MNQSVKQTTQSLIDRARRRFCFFVVLWMHGLEKRGCRWSIDRSIDLLMGLRRCIGIR